MKKIYTLIGFSLLALNVIAQENKWQFGLGVDVFQAKLVNISKDYDRQFHSVPYYTQYDYDGINPGIHVIRHMSEHWSLKSGLSFVRHQSKFHFVYTDYLGLDIDAELNNRFNYLVVPIMANYRLFNWKNSNLAIGGGALNKILWSYDSNFPDIINYLIYIPTDARTYVLGARLEAKYEWIFKDRSRIGFHVFVSRDITAYLDKNIGFMHNLKPSRYLFGGLGLSYTF